MAPSTQVPAPAPIPAPLPLQRDIIQPGSESAAVSELPLPPKLFAVPSTLIPCPSTHPLTIPEILEQVLLYVLDQFLSASHSHPFAYSSTPSAATAAASLSSYSPSSLSLTWDIQLQIRKQRRVSTQLAFLRVCRLWYHVGEPLLWRNVKWADYQPAQVHQGIWTHWDRVRRLEFEYGKRTTDTEDLVTTAAEPEIVTTTTTTTTATWSNGTRARMRNLLGGDSPSAATASSSSSSMAAAAAAVPGGSATLVSIGGLGVNGTSSQTDASTSSMTATGITCSSPTPPKISLENALDQLAQAMSKPSTQPRYRPSPLPLRSIYYHKRITDAHGQLIPPPINPPLLHRSQLTHLTLRGHFRLETFLETILPFVPELTYLDIYLRCYEWRDEIQLDRVLRSCPKLQYLSVERNMCGRVAFDDPVSSESDQDQAGWMYGDDDDDDDEDGEKGMDYVDENDGEQQRRLDGLYAGTSWHLKYVKVNPACVAVDPQNSFQSEIMDERQDGHSTTGDPQLGSRHQASPSNTTPNTSTSERIRRRRRQPRQKGQQPLALKVLKLKKIRMTERDFLQLLKLCPRLEEMDVFSTIYWSWSRAFLDNVAISCPGVRRLHLTTNYERVNSENNTGHAPDPMQAGIVIFHDAVPDPTQASSTLGADAAGSPLPLPFDPVVELIKLYPELVSYDARYVRFQDRALMTLQQTCRQLERLDLTFCRELSSKAVDQFLRHAPTLKHFSASQILLRIEDLIEAAEEHDRAVATHGNNAIASEQTPRWWACQDLETFIMGVKNPVLPCASREFDLQCEQATDFQFYYRDGQVGSSSKAHRAGGTSSSSGGHGSSHRGPEQLYDHIQYCTFVLFQQLGRLRKLTRLELHGGRFDLQIQRSSSNLFQSTYSGAGMAMDHQDKDSNRSQKYKESDSDNSNNNGKENRKRLMIRVKGLLNLGGGEGKRKTKDEGSQNCDSDKATKDKGKERDKGKGRAEITSPKTNRGNKSGHGYNGEGSSDTWHSKGGFIFGGGGVTDTGVIEQEQQRMVPSQWNGLSPLAGLEYLRSFSMTWSNFPQLREQEMAWICQHWTHLESISLGLVPESEWDQIRHWVRCRRPDVIVVFER